MDKKTQQIAFVALIYARTMASGMSRLVDPSEYEGETSIYVDDRRIAIERAIAWMESEEAGQRFDRIYNFK